MPVKLHPHPGPLMRVGFLCIERFLVGTASTACLYLYNLAPPRQLLCGKNLPLKGEGATRDPSQAVEAAHHGGGEGQQFAG